MKIKNIKIKNILSIEQAELSFDSNGLVLIEGYDYDSGRANGAGKSAIFNALSFGLYDQVPRKITKTEIVRRGSNSASVEITIDADGKEYKVIRNRPASVEFFKDDIKIDINQQEFEAILGLSYDQFLVTIYNSQDSRERFLNLNDRDKKEFLLKIMDLGNFSNFKKKISEELAKLSLEKEILKTKIEGNNNSISIYKAQLVDPEESEDKIKELDKNILSYNRSIKELEKITEPDVSKYIELEKQVQNKLLDIQSTRATSLLKRAELKKLQSLTPDAECPHCKEQLNIINGKLFKSENQNAIDDQIKVVSAQINDYENQLLKENEIKQLSEKIRLKKIDDYKDYNNAIAAIAEYKNSIIFSNKEIQSLKNLVSKNDNIKMKIDDLMSDKRTNDLRLLSVLEEIKILETVSSFFDPTGAPAYIMDSVVDSFNESVTDYINFIWSNASYSLQTFKENKDKTISTKFSECLMIDGKQVSIGSLSGGELRALSLSVDFAIIDVLKSKFSIELNPIILDEPFDGLDVVGRELVIELLSNISQNCQVMVIDHSSEAKSMFNKIIRIEKRNGVSSLT